MAEEDSSFSSSSSSQNNVGNDALFVIELHGSGDAIAHFLQDWEATRVALSCQKALGHVGASKCMKSKGDLVGWVSERARRLSDKPL